MIGVQLKDISLKEEMTNKLKEAKDELVELLENDEWRDIPKLKKPE